MKIKKGTPCFISKTGHNNFFYPIFDKSGLSYFAKDVDNCETKSWVCGKPELAAVIVEATDILNLYGTSKTVVWIEKKHLEVI
tara:strand:+ start:1196 stop:1444 length:249 start_codon:yes stop_codon:yes gene_type:complete